MTSPWGGREGQCAHTETRKDRTSRAHDDDGRATEDESDERVIQELNYESEWEDTTILQGNYALPASIGTTSPLEPASALSSSK